MICDVNLLPVGEPLFSNLRELGQVYVDKTDLIYNIAIQRGPIFFARPRRFGKSLLLNTFKSLFSTGLNDFKGLAIEKYWHDKTYKVVHIDFSRMADDDTNDLIYKLSEKLIREFKVNDTVSLYDAGGKVKSPDIILDQICEKLNNYSIVLLIDEYDAPLVHHIDDNNQLSGILKTLRSFYSTVKEHTGKFRFIFITGVTRISHLSIFSAFNNLKDLSFVKEYNTLLGFTQNDLVKFFDLYIENAANILHMSKDSVYARLEDYYDGFKFVPDADETLYNPWSILRFLNYPIDRFMNYWFKSGGTPSIIMQYLKVKDYFDYIVYSDREICIDINKLSDCYEIENIPAEILLCQAGYFSPYAQNDGSIILRPPNSEVEDSLLRLYLTANNVKENNDLRSKRQTLVADIDAHNLKNIVDTFNTILNTVVSNNSKIFEDERSVRDIIFASILLVRDLEKFKEKYTLKGFADLELTTKRTHLVIEFKRTYPRDKNNPKNHPRDAKKALDLAIEQIKTHDYGKIIFETQTLYRVAMVISTEEKRILYEYCQEVS